MVRAWVYSESNDESLRKNVSLNYLSKLGVLYWKIEPSRYQDDQVFNTVRLERNYKNHDIVRFPSLFFFIDLIWCTKDYCFSSDSAEL
jgi:hypothetical protein